MKKGNYQYVSSDLSGDFIADVSYDITGIESEDESYDLIICYHILEHVENDIKAIKELYRVLKKKSYCLVQTPFKEGDIYEGSSVKTAAEREIHFGQSDHIRIYSVNGLKDRLEDAGFVVEVRQYVDKVNNACGFNEKEIMLVCFKPD